MSRIGPARPSAFGPDRAGAAWLAGFAVSSAVGIWSSFHIGGGLALLTIRWHLFEHFAVWFGAWVISVVCALHLPRRGALALILLVAVILRCGALENQPRLSNDVYRYSWDARVQLAGIDPYRYPPDSVHLRPLREDYTYPTPAGCVAMNLGLGCTILNRPTVRTIYPPLAEAWFTAVYWLGGGIHARYKPFQFAGFATELGSMTLIVLLLRKRRRDPRWVALYALSPIPVTEAVNNAHVDGLAVMLVLAALVVLGAPPGQRAVTGVAGAERTVGERSVAPGWNPGRRAVLAGVLVGAAILVKLYPAAVLVPLVGAPWLRLRQRVAALGAALVTVAVGYLPHVVAVGVKVVGYLPGYLKAENYTGTGTRYLLVDLLRVKSTHEIDAVVAAIVVATCLFIVWRRPDPVLSCGLLFGVLLLVANPVQPWYSMVLLAVAAASPRPRWGLVAAAGYPYFFSVILSALHRTGIGQISYGVALLGVVATAVVTRLRTARSPGAPATDAERPSTGGRPQPVGVGPAPPPGP